MRKSPGGGSISRESYQRNAMDVMNMGWVMQKNTFFLVPFKTWIMRGDSGMCMCACLSRYRDDFFEISIGPIRHHIL